MTRNGFRNIFVAPRTWRARLGMISGGLCVLAACAALRYGWGPSAAKAQVSAEPAPPASAPMPAVPGDAPRSPPSVRSATSAIPGRTPVPEVVASVNGHSISRGELAEECRIHYGKEVLESMVK